MRHAADYRPLKNGFFRRRRGDESQISVENRACLETRHFVSCFFNRLMILRLRKLPPAMLGKVTRKHRVLAPDPAIAFPAMRKSLVPKEAISFQVWHGPR